MRIEFDKLNKINVKELTDAQTKHLVVKALVVQRLLLKYRSINNYIRVYTEMPINNSKSCDVLFENWKTKEVYAYEIQSLNTPKWRLETAQKYAAWIPYGFNTADWSIIDLNKLSDKINEIKIHIDKLII